MKEVIQEIIAEFHENEVNQSVERDFEIPFTSGKIITLIGPRRSGKSFLFFNLINKLIGKGVKKKQVIYLNFEDERLDISVIELDLILQGYRELYPDEKLNKCYFFFDEIQNINGWEKFIRRVYDTYSKNIFITGSNANLLSKEIATALRGRTLSFEILPLSFKEYLKFKGVDFRKKDATIKAKINKLLGNYLVEGGFPELLHIDGNFKTKVLQEYFDVMIYRDLIQRYQFTNLSVVKYFLKRLASNTCSYVSLNKIYNELRSQGYKLDKNLLYEVYEAAQSIYLSLSIKKFNYSILKQENSDNKAYFIDNGLLNALTFKFSKDQGHLLENLVYLELRRRENKIFYYKNGKECDFIIQKKDEVPTAIQVCYNMQDPETRNREIKSLLYACEKLKLKSGIILTMNERDEKRIEGIRIRTIPVVKFLLEETESGYQL